MGNISTIFGGAFRALPNNEQSQVLGDPVAQFAAAIHAIGLIEDRPVASSKIQRCKTNDDKPGKQSGWYVFFMDGDVPAGAFGDWRDGETHTWSADIGRPLTDAEIERNRSRMEQAKREREETRKAEADSAAIGAMEIVNRAAPADDNHPYLMFKKVQAHGLLESGGKLIIPLRSINGKIQTLQTIDDNGDKRLHKGGSKKGAFFLLGSLANAKKIYIAEGFSTAATVFEATQIPTLMAIDAGNLVHVARTIREEYPALSIVIAADADDAGRKHAQTAAQAVNGKVIEPDFLDHLKGTDWNDLAVILGLDAVKMQIQQHNESTEAPLKHRFWSATDIDPGKIPQRDWICGHAILANYITFFFAPGGTGKSQIANTLAISVAAGMDLLGDQFSVKRPRNVAIINNEDDEHELSRRIHGICGHHKVKPSRLDGRLHIMSGYESVVRLATEHDKKVLRTQHAEELIDYIKDHDIGVLVIDPFVSFHDVGENDNNAMNDVVTILRNICARTSVAIFCVAHTRKTGGDSESHAGDIEALRGGKALSDGGRVALTAARMGSATAEKLNLDKEVASSLVRLDDAKMNFAPRDAEAMWIRLASHKLPNGDWVGVPELYDITPHEKAAEDLQSKHKMTASGFAELVEKTIGADIRGQSEFQFSSVKERMMQASGYGRAILERYVTLLSQNRSIPTRISTNSGGLIDYWIDKPNGAKTAPWTIHREELK